MSTYESGRKHGQTTTQSLALYSRLLTAKQGERLIIATPARTIEITVTDIENH